MPLRSTICAPPPQNGPTAFPKIPLKVSCAENPCTVTRPTARAEKSGSLEAFALRSDGNVESVGLPVAGIPAGVIVGIAGIDDLVVAPVAHLATDANMSTIPVASGTVEIQQVPTKEVAACWTAAEEGEVCITNPGSQTVSCGDRKSVV